MTTRKEKIEKTLKDWSSKVINDKDWQAAQEVNKHMVILDSYYEFGDFNENIAFWADEACTTAFRMHAEADMLVRDFQTTKPVKKDPAELSKEYRWNKVKEANKRFKEAGFTAITVMSTKHIYNPKNEFIGKIVPSRSSMGGYGFVHSEPTNKGGIVGRNQAEVKGKIVDRFS